MSGVSKGVIGFLVARPLIALGIAAVVVGVLLLVQTHRQKTPVIHREERVGLTDGNDAGLATVLGHEVAHATAEHVAERIERQHLTEVAAAIIAGGVAVTPGQYIRVRARRGMAARSRARLRPSELNTQRSSFGTT